MLEIFMSTGEASGDMLAATLAEAMRRAEPAIAFSGIGSERMAAAGFRLRARTRRWASMGPLEALRRIPPILFAGWIQYIGLLRRPPDLLVLVDFGALNLRLAKALRRARYRGRILYYFPPGAWLDRESQARAVAQTSCALTPFEHQRNFYRSLGLPVAWFGHPLVSLIDARVPREPAPPGGGVVALLPGSRVGEIRRHTPLLFAACAELRARRPKLDVVIGVADADCERLVRREMQRTGFAARVVAGSRAALDQADAAFIASGTAVLEAALREVPTVSFYVIARAQIEYVKRVWRRPYFTLPNLLLEREAVPEFFQDAATPAALAGALEPMLADPSPAIAALREVRTRLGPADALERCAAYALRLARGGACEAV
jgi:lipid-A-disaccharide synthase